MLATLRSTLAPAPLLLAGLVLTLAACGGRQAPVEGGEDILVGDGPSLIGELEEQAEGFVLDMTFVLTSNMDDPVRATERFEAFVLVNGEAMVENARALEEKFAGLTGAERRAYEAQLAAHLAEATTGWREQIARFHAANPDAGDVISRLLRGLDHQRSDDE